MRTYKQDHRGRWQVLGSYDQMTPGPHFVQTQAGTARIEVIIGTSGFFVDANGKEWTYGQLSPRRGHPANGRPLPERVDWYHLPKALGLSEVWLRRLRKGSDPTRPKLPPAYPGDPPTWDPWHLDEWLGRLWPGEKDWPRRKKALEGILALGTPQVPRQRRPRRQLAEWQRKATFNASLFVPLDEAIKLYPDVEKLLEAEVIPGKKRHRGTCLEYGCEFRDLWPFLVPEGAPDLSTALRRAPYWFRPITPWLPEPLYADAREAYRVALEHPLQPSTILEEVLALPPIQPCPIESPYTSWPNLPPIEVPERYRKPGETAEEALGRLQSERVEQWLDWVKAHEGWPEEWLWSFFPGWQPPETWVPYTQQERTPRDLILSLPPEEYLALPTELRLWVEGYELSDAQMKTVARQREEVMAHLRGAPTTTL